METRTQRVSVSEFVDAYNAGRELPVELCMGLCGRVMATKGVAQKLSDTPGKRLAWILGGDGLAAVIGKKGWDLMRIVGHDADWVNMKLNQGHKFKFAIFPSLDCVLADWEGIFKVLEEAFSDVWHLIQPHTSSLKSMTYDEIQSQFTEFNIKEVDLIGRHDPRFTTTERLKLRENPSLGLIRAFLYHEVGLTFLYSGKGHTLMEGTLEKGLTEYLTRNKAIQDIEHLQLIDIEINQLEN